MSGRYSHYYVWQIFPLLCLADILNIMSDRYSQYHDWKIFPIIWQADISSIMSGRYSHYYVWRMFPILCMADIPNQAKINLFEASERYFFLKNLFSYCVILTFVGGKCCIFMFATKNHDYALCSNIEILFALIFGFITILTPS